MLRVILKYISFFFLLLILSSCIQESEPPVNKAIEGSNEVLNIPVKRRWKEYNEGNKVFNSSFENGRVFNNNFHTFEINRWSKIGNKIVWVDTDDKEFNKNDVSSGKHAVKIKNESRDETGEDKTGILSDYIKVLNGNYRLSFDIKLSNICPYNSRFGSRLLDAVNIRVFYYDKNKIRLSGKTFAPEQVKYVDNEFKALPFSGFWKIDSLGWIRSKGITSKFPFPDGDFPKETKYVRIFFGLKGSGTMWVDNVNLKYTRQNFSVKEFLKPYKDSVFQQTDLILPTPKHLRPGKKYALFKSENNIISQPLIVIPSSSGELTKKAAKSLQRKLQQLSHEKFPERDTKIEITRSPLTEELEGKSIVFSIGNNSLYRSFKTGNYEDSVKEHSNGYFIYKAGKNTPVITLKGTNDIGNYYAVQTIRQLFDKNADYHHANIIDYPDFQNRGVVCETNKQSFKQLKNKLQQYRFTHLYSALNNGDNLNQITSSFKNLIDLTADNSLLKPGIAFNPYRSFQQKESNVTQPEVSHFSDIINLLKQAQSKGINNFIVRVDSTFNTSDSCSCVFNFISAKNHLKYRSLLDVHKEMINKIADNLQVNTAIKFLPLWHHNQCVRKSNGRGELYLKELFRKIPDKVDYLWTGASGTPYLIDEAELIYIKRIVNKKPLFYSKDIHPFSDAIGKNKYAQNYPGKLRASSIFQQFNLEPPNNFNCQSAKKSFLAEINYNNSLDDIKLLCFADYLWNSNEYNSNISLLKALISNFGKKQAFALIEFNDLYQGLQEMLIKMNKLETRRKYIRSAEDYISRLNNLMDELENLLEGTLILEDIQKMQKKLKEQFEGMVG